MRFFESFFITLHLRLRKIDRRIKKIKQDEFFLELYFNED